MPRWALPVLLLGVLGLALWFWRGQGVERSTAPQPVDRPDPGYVSLDADLVQTDEQGRPVLRLRASRVARGAADAPIDLTDPVIDYGSDSSAHWQLSARSGRYDTGAGSVALSNQVLASGRLGASPELNVRSEALQLDLAHQSVSSTVGVTIDQAGYRLAACRMEADLERQKLQLEPTVMVRRNTGAWAAGALLALCGAQAPAGGAADAASAPNGSGPRCADGAPGDPVLESRGGLEAQPGGVVIRDVVITQCDNRISADVADASGQGIQFDDSHWQFSGHVQLQVGHGTLLADQATVEFAHGQIAGAVANGNPASFRQPADTSSGPASGHAQQIAYDAASNDVVLSGQAWLQVGRAEVNVERIRYNIGTRRIQSESQGESSPPVRITIQPRSGQAAPANPPPAGGSQPK